MLQAISRSRLAALYGISRKTLYLWCKIPEIDLPDKEQINVKDVDYQVKVNTKKYANGTYLIQIQSTTGEITTQKIQILK